MSLLYYSKPSNGSLPHPIRIYWICTSPSRRTPPPHFLPLFPGPTIIQLQGRSWGSQNRPATLLPQETCTCCSLYLFHSSLIFLYWRLSHLGSELRGQLSGRPHMFTNTTPAPAPSFPLPCFIFHHSTHHLPKRVGDAPLPRGAKLRSWGPTPLPTLPALSRRLTRLRSWAACSLW